MYQYFLRLFLSFFFFFNDTATTEIYTLSLHDALPILAERAEEIDLDRARAARERAEKRLANPNASGTDWDRAVFALQRALTRLQVAAKGGGVAAAQQEHHPAP